MSRNKMEMADAAGTTVGVLVWLLTVAAVGLWSGWLVNLVD